MSEEGRFRGWDHWRLVVVITVFCLVAVWFCVQVLWPSATTLTHGFGAYYSASRLLSNRELSADIYDPVYFLPIVQRDSLGQAEDIFNANLPTTTLMFLLFSNLPIQQARSLWTIINIGLLLVGLGLLLWVFGRSLRDWKNWYLWLLVLALGMLFKPVVRNFEFGQAYILVFFLMSVTTAAFFQKKTSKNQAVGGIALALSLVLKMAGWPLLIFLLWQRRIRLLSWVVGFGVAVFLITLPIFKVEMWLVYSRLLSQVGRSPLVCVPAYQTTRSWLCHLFAPNVFWQEAEMAGTAIPWPVNLVYFILGTACLFILLRLARNRPDAAFLGFICWYVLFLPLGETHHHTVMLIPLVWFMVRWSKKSRFSRVVFVLAVICYLISFPINAPQYQSGWLALLAYPYLAGAWLIFLGILWDHRSEMLPGPGQPR
jgi:hypothetical protein